MILKECPRKVGLRSQLGCSANHCKLKLKNEKAWEIMFYKEMSIFSV